jgi:hypothetical protein
LIRHWDPIGIADEPDARDEYDSFLPRIADRLRYGARAEEIATFLGGFSGEYMGLAPDGANDLRAAAVVVAWYDVEMSRPGAPTDAMGRYEWG